MPSTFLQLPATEWLASNDLAFAIRAPDAASPGHTLVVPRRLVPSYFDATREEKAALWALVDEMKVLLDEQLHPDGYDVAFTTGALAGPRVPHAHIAIIPRFREPAADATSARRAQGAPHPSDAARHERRPPLATGGGRDPLSRHLGPLFSAATDIAIVAAFVTETGLAVVQRWIFDALRAGVQLRIVTGDYLAFTQVDALRQLLGWTALELDAPGDLLEPPRRGQLRVRVVETALADGSERAFHPKSWLFESFAAGVAFVGSSNLSRSALETGIEWNLRVERGIDPVGYASVRAAFEALWASAIDLTEDWIDAYAQRVRQAPRTLPPGAADAEPLDLPPRPHEFQEQALAALARARAQGRRRALVVLATGLGKTWLAAFDVARFARATGTWPRVLFLAHRAELLAQAARTFRRLLVAAAQPADVGWCAGALMNPGGRVVVGSIQKLARAENLERIAAERFDYVIVDEVHHADAPTYRRLLDRLDPSFLLGLTATPDRADEGDILGLFDDFVAYRADLGVGIQSGRLVPFAYHGVRDDIDYAQIPWRNRRFDPAALAAAVQTQRRMERLWSAWRDHPATRTLVFCCSIEHARFAATWLAERGVRVDAVYQGPGSGDRGECVARLQRGELDALCVVDMFNEGVDIPAIDRVVMLRPTESPVIFLQQLGRGLRRSEGKDQLTIIDFVGNHQLFLGRIRRLLSLAPSPTSVRDYLESNAPPELPPGCSIDLELELKELLRAFLPRGALEVERVYRELVHERGERPSIGELHRMGYRPSTLRRAHDGWFPFVASEGHLGDDERRTLDALGSWFDELEAGAFPSPLPLVVLEVLFEAEALTTGIGQDDLAQRGRAFLARSPELQRAPEGLTSALAARSDEWQSFWREQAVAPWTRGQGWFAIEADRLVPRRLAAAAGVDSALTRMTRELVDYRLHVFRARAAPDSAGNAFSCTVLWNKRDPILKLPRRSTNPTLPTGEVDVRLPDGAVWRFRFAKEFINVAYPAGTNGNRLPDLMRRWFGPNAGHPGTRFEVHFSRSPDGWWIEPLGKLPALPARGRLVGYPSLRAAAGIATGERAEPPEPELVTLPLEGDTDDLFAVRAAGDSMNGGKTPIADGDWLVLRWARGASIGSLQGRVALLQVPDSHETFAYQVKRIVRDGERWWLRSENPERPSIEATPETVPIAQLVTRIAPEMLAPTVGEGLTPESMAAAFGLAPETVIERSGRYEGHLFIVVDQPGVLVEPDRLAMVVHDRRPGETAFVLARREGESRWRYCGVGRWLEDEQLWTLPPLDFATWRALGKGRDCSRRLPDAAKERANRFLDELFQRAGPGDWIVHDGKRCRLVERTAGGVRIDGGEGGLAPRLVSSTDLAWVMLAADDVASTGGVLDEARVNRMRYLEGTPKGSTRWIDTGWGIVLLDGRVEKGG